MKFIKINFFIIIIFTSTLVGCAQNTKEKNTIHTTEVSEKDKVINLISPEELNKKLGEITLIDIRTPQEFSEGHLKNAANINLFDPNFIQKMNKFDKSKVLYIYCRSGNRTSSAAKKLAEIGFVKIYDLQGGILNWRKNNMEVIK
ncbi:MAG: rhodanese-like domain-containing protein [Bacteroidota bacterium]